MRASLIVSLLLAACSSRVLLGDAPDGSIPDGSVAGDLAGDAATLPDLVTPPVGSWAAVSSGTTADLYGVVGAQFGTEVTVVGTFPGAVGVPGVVLRYNGTSWSTLPSIALTGVSGWNANPLIATGGSSGEGSVTRWTGSSWTPPEVVTTGNLNGVWYPISSLNFVVVVGDGGKVFSSDGALTTWTSVTTGTTQALHAVWGSSINDVYAVGGSGVVVRGKFGSTTWSTTMPGFVDWFGVWGSSATDVYLVGGDPGGGFGAAFHSIDGGMSWTPATTSLPGLYAVWGNSGTDVYAVGAGGAIFHTTGNNVWTQETSPTTQDLRGIWGSPSAGIYVVGKSGTILHKTP